MRPPDHTRSDTANQGRAHDGKDFSRRLAHPTYRSAQLAHLRLELEQQYPDLAESLNLQPDEATRLLALLAKQALSDREYEMNLNDAGQITDEAVAARRQAGEERRRADEAQLAALLGEAKLQEWHQYQDSLGARAQVRELKTMLAESEIPLRDDQFRPLVAALAVELQRHAEERQALYDGTRNPTQPTPEEVVRYMGRRLELIEQSLQRQRRAAAPYLSSEQQKRYDEMLSRERRRAQIDHDLFVTLNTERPP